MILVTGGSGFLGWNLLRTAPKGGFITGAYHQHRMTEPDVSWVRLDLTSRADIERVLEEVKPRVIIHTAAEKDVDTCEKNPARARLLNAEATRILAEISARSGIRLIYVSTDLVFDGSKPFWREDDAANGRGVYAESKREGEKIVLAHPQNAVARVALLYGWSNGVNKSFIDWMWSNLGHSRPVPLFTDQYRTPTLVDDAGMALLALANRSDLRGIFHVAGPERISRYEFGVRVCEHFPFDPRYLRPVLMSELSTHVPRPADCSLNTEKLARELGIKMSNVDEGLEKMSARLRGGAE